MNVIKENITGKVKWFNDQKGYGFIIANNPADCNEDIMIHYSAIKADGFKSLNNDDNVKFDLVQTEKGIQAINCVKF